MKTRMTSDQICADDDDDDDDEDDDDDDDGSVIDSDADIFFLPASFVNLSDVIMMMMTMKMTMMTMMTTMTKTMTTTMTTTAAWMTARTSMQMTFSLQSRRQET